jgi:hypothetical protein
MLSPAAVPLVSNHLCLISFLSSLKASTRIQRAGCQQLIFIYFFLVRPLQQEISFTTMPIKNGRKIKMADQIIGKENT